MLMQSGMETDKLRISGEAMILTNLTPHELVIFDERGENEVARLPQSGEAARVKTQATKVGALSIDGHDVPIVETSYGEIEGLPDPQDGTTYVVSIIVVQAVRGQRNDVVAPDTGLTAVRFADGPQKGQIKGVRRFTR